MSLSRRELLTAMLGAPLGAQACERGPRSRNIDGEIRGASMEVGHRLRGASVERASGAPERVGIAIVGAGMSGLSAAWRLERLGEKSFLVLDLEGQPGGTSAYGTDGVAAYPWGAHYVPVPSRDNRAFVALLQEMNALEPAREDEEPRGREELLIRAPEERLYLEGAWHEGLYPHAGASPADLDELARFEKEIERWVAFRGADGRRAFTVPAARCSSDPRVTELDRKNATQWLDEHGFRSARLRWFVEYATRDDYGLALDQTSAWAMLFYFAARVPRPGATSAPFLTWPEGNGRVVQHLAKVAGRRLRTAMLVTDVVPSEDSVELGCLDAASGHLSRIVADRVVLAVPKMVAARIVRPWRERPPGFLASFTYGVWMVANLHLRRRPPSRGFPFAWDNVLYDSPALGYVVSTHQTLRDRGPAVWTYYYPFTDADPDAARRRLAELDHGAAVETVMSDLGRAHDDLEDVVDRIDVWRWGHAMIRPVPGLVQSEALRRAREPFGRIHFAHSDLSGVALFEEAQYHGIRAAEEVLRARGREVKSLLD